MQNKTSDVSEFVVAGAGIVGLCTAIRAQRAGYKVTLIDPNSPGTGCSKGNAGHFATEQVFPLADPALLPALPGMLFNPLGPLSVRPRYWLRALPWFTRFLLQMRASRRQHNTRILSALCQDAMNSWQALLAGCNLHHHLQRAGNLLVFERADSATVARQARQYQSQGVDLAVLNRAELRSLCPGIADSVTAAIWFKNTGHCTDPFALSQALFQQFLAAGGHWLETGVSRIAPGTPHRLTLQNGTELNADQLVLSAGIHSQGLCEQLGYRVPLEAERGYHLNTRPTTMPPMAIASYDRKFIMTPMDRKLRLAGTVEFAGADAAPDYRRADQLYQHGVALWPALAQAPDPRLRENQWMGNRPSLPDSLPVISGSRWPGLWFNFGHQHLGLTLAAISAEHLMALIRGNESPLARALSIDRF